MRVLCSTERPRIGTKVVVVFFLLGMKLFIILMKAQIGPVRKIIDFNSFLPARASEQGNVIGLVSMYRRVR